VVTPCASHSPGAGQRGASFGLQGKQDKGERGTKQAVEQKIAFTSAQPRRRKVQQENREDKETLGVECFLVPGWGHRRIELMRHRKKGRSKIHYDQYRSAAMKDADLNATKTLQER